MTSLRVPSHRVRLELVLDKLPFPTRSGTARVAGEYELPADMLYDTFAIGCRDAARLDKPLNRHAKELVLNQLMRGLERLVLSIEDRLREDWGMETRKEKQKREYLEERQRRTTQMFRSDYGFSQGEFDSIKRFIFGKTKVEDEDYPLGEQPPIDPAPSIPV